MPGAGDTTGRDGPLLKPKQVRLIAALCVEPDTRRACAAAGCGKTSAYRWLADPAFRDALQRARAEATEQALNGLRALAGRAVAVLGKLLDGAETERTALDAAKAIIDRAFRVAENEDIARRLDALEDGKP
jgi:hypothetical protein